MEVDFLPMSLVGFVDAAKLERHPIFSYVGMDPAGRFSFLKYVSHRRQIYQMNATAILLDAPVMGVSVNIRFHLLARADHVK